MPEKQDRNGWQQRWDTLEGAARVAGVPRSTVRDALDRGEVGQVHLPSGTRLVNLDDVRRLARHPRRPGRPKSTA